MSSKNLNIDNFLPIFFSLLLIAFTYFVLVPTINKVISEKHNSHSKLKP